MFLNSASIGIITAFVSDLSYIIKRIFKNNYVINIVIDFCIYFIGSTFVFLVSTKLNNNIFNFYEPLGFVMGVFLEKISCSKLFAKIFDMLYNNCVETKQKFKITRVGKRIFK